MKRSLNTARMNVRVGVMSLIAFIILVWVLFFPVRGTSPFSNKLRFTGYYTQVDGLRRGAPTYYRGIEVGSVESVEVVPEHPEAPLKVVVSVEKRIVPLLAKGTRMEIVARGLLGDVFVDMVAPAYSGPHVASIQDGDVLDTKPYQSAMASMSGVVDELKTLLANANKGEGTLGHIVRNDELYVELVKAVKSMGQVAARVSEIERTVNEKLLDKNTKESVDAAVATAHRVLKRADDLTAKASDLHWYLGVGLNKYEGPMMSSLFDVTIVPNKDKFYKAGVEYFKDPTPIGPTDYSSTLGGYLGYNAYLGLRVLDSPFFFRGGLKRTSVAAGGDLRIGDLTKGWVPVELSADMSKFSQPNAQMDLGASLTFLKVFKISGGADDVMNKPFYRAGLSLIYDDEDLTSILIKSKM